MQRRINRLAAIGLQIFHHEIKQADGRTLQGKAARIFRCRPDGSGVERVCGGGMDNPVEIAFTAEGEALATVDILIGSPSRNDALIHCIEGGVFPYYLPVLGENFLSTVQANLVHDTRDSPMLPGSG